MAILAQTAVWATAAVALAQACVRERDFASNKQQLVRRQDPVSFFPPVWDENESILANSFETTSLDTWSYYYTHGLHVAGTNKSMAQWTVDRWNENGFTASLAEYCMPQTSLQHIASIGLTNCSRRFP